MHAPDGFLNAGTAVATGALSVSTVGVALRQTRDAALDRQIPLAGLTAAFIFAAQMINFPVAAGTTGHLLGGALAAVLLGPAMGALVVTVVVVVQAIAFADGGLTALGYNVLNMAVVTSFGGYGLFLVFRRLLPRNRGGVIATTGLAAAGSVVLAAVAFSIEWLFGATAPVPFDTVLGSMTGVHLLIGIGEGVISGLTVAAVLAARPDLVYGASGLDLGDDRRQHRVRFRTVAIAGIAATLVLAMVVSQFAAEAPDGLERVAIDSGISGEESALRDSIFADHATTGIRNENFSLPVAGAAGALLSLAVAGGLVAATRGGRHASRS